VHGQQGVVDIRLIGACGIEEFFHGSMVRIGSIISCAFGQSDLGALRRYKSLMWLGHTARFAPGMASLTLTAKFTSVISAKATNPDGTKFPPSREYRS
jgi:hypothetical protein